MNKEVSRQLAAAVICLLMAIGFVACGGGDETKNASPTPAATSPSTPQPTQPAVSEDNALKNKVEANLTKYGVTGITVEVSGGEVTLKGDIPRAKLQDAMKAANEASPKKVNNQLNIK